MELLTPHPAPAHGTAAGTGQNWFQTHPESRWRELREQVGVERHIVLCAQQAQLPRAGPCREPQNPWGLLHLQGAEPRSAALASPGDAAGAQGVRNTLGSSKLYFYF